MVGLPVVPDEAEGVIRQALAQIEAERKLADMAPAAVESVPEQDADAASAAPGGKMELLMQQHTRHFLTRLNLILQSMQLVMLEQIMQSSHYMLHSLKECVIQLVSNSWQCFTTKQQIMKVLSM